MIADHLRLAIKADIRAHLLSQGSQGWTALRGRYPEVSPATFWRLLRQVKGETRASAGEVTHLKPSHLSETSKQFPRHEADRKAASPSGEKRRRMNVMPLFLELGSLISEAELLREYAMDESGRIRHPEAFAKSIKLREGLISRAVNIHYYASDAEAQKQFYDLLIDKIAGASPEVAKTIVVALRELNKGWTCYSEPEASGDASPGE